MCDVDCDRVSARQRKECRDARADSIVPAFAVLPPPPAAPRSLSQADIASVHAQLAEGRAHVMHSFGVLGGGGRRSRCTAHVARGLGG
eukprot:831675-Pyramimonas_sp.AAC.1